MPYVRKRMQGISERLPISRTVNYQQLFPRIYVHHHLCTAHQIYINLKAEAKEKRDTSVALVRGMDQEFQDQFAKMEMVR